MDPKHIFFTKQELKELDEMLKALKQDMLRLKSRTDMTTNLNKYNEIERGLKFIDKIRDKINPKDYKNRIREDYYGT